MIILAGLLIGFFAAVVGSLVGLGGGIVLIPAMLFLYDNVEGFSWADPQAIVGISLVTMIFTGLSSAIGYYKLNRVDMKTGLIFLIGSLPGSVLGAWLNTRLDTDAFSLYFGILMIVIFLMLMIDRQKLVKNKKIAISSRTRTFEIDGETYQYNVNYTPAFILSFLIGALSGLFGIGGGTISVPAMILFFGIPVQVAIGTSMFMIFFISLISSSTHIILGHIVWKYVIFFIIGSYLGGSVGARMSKWFKGNTLEWFLRAVILLAAVRLIYESIT